MDFKRVLSKKATNAHSIDSSETGQEGRDSSTMHSSAAYEAPGIWHSPSDFNEANSKQEGRPRIQFKSHKLTISSSSPSVRPPPHNILSPIISSPRHPPRWLTIPLLITDGCQPLSQIKKRTRDGLPQRASVQEANNKGVCHARIYSDASSLVGQSGEYLASEAHSGAQRDPFAAPGHNTRHRRYRL